MSIPPDIVENLGRPGERPLRVDHPVGTTKWREVTPERVKSYFGEMVKGDVDRFELPNLHALNLMLHQGLGGGGTMSLRTDAQGKTMGAALLAMEIDVDERELTD